MLHPYSFGMVARRFALGMLGLAFAASAQAQIGTYSFANPTSVGDEVTYPVDAQPQNASFSPISRGAGVKPSASAGTFSASSWTLGTTPDETDYFTFSITPDAGYKLTLTSLTLDERRSGAGIGEWVLRSSLDNFKADLIKVTVPDDTNNRLGTKIDLPAATFTDVSSAVEFRLYGYKAEQDGGTWRLDNIKLDGTISGGSSTPTAPVLSFGAAAVTVAENVGTVKIPVKLSAASTKEIKVDVVLATPSGTATTGDDFTFTKTTLTFPANSVEQTAEVVIVDDNAQEAAETIILGLENASPTEEATIAAGTSTITIEANDAPTVITVSPIGTLTVNDANGVPVQNGQTVSVKGIVYGVNTRTTGYQNLAIKDATGSIGLFSSLNVGDVTALKEGDEVEVTGVLTQFNGLSQIALTSGNPAAAVPNATIKVVSSNNTLMAARTVTGALVEADESDLVAIGPVTAVDPTKWITTSTASGYNVEVKNAEGTIYNVRINKGTDVYNSAAPTGSFTLTGVVTQFDSSSPYTEGYQIVPRRLTDLVAVVSANREPAFGRTVQLYPNPATRALTLELGLAGRGATVEVLNVLGQRLSTRTVAGATTSLEVAGLQRGTYLVRISTTEGTVTRRFVKQ